MKLALVLVIMLVLMLPAASSAHSPGWGGSGSWGSFWTKTSVSVEVQAGPNYYTAKHLGAIQIERDSSSYYSKFYSFFCGSGGKKIEKVDLEGMQNYTTVLYNVLDINVTYEKSMSYKGISFDIGMIGDFPNGSRYMVSTSQLDSSSNISYWHSFSSTDPTSLSFSINTCQSGVQTYYISFYLPPSDSYVGSNAELWYQAG